MYQEQRLAEILELLAEKKQLSAKDMIEHFQVSKDTIRRDFSILSERRLVQRTHGGIIPLDTSRQIPSFNDRINQLSQEKRLLLRRLMTFSSRGRLLSLMSQPSFSIWPSASRSL